MASYFFVTEKRFAKEMAKIIPLPAGRQDGRSVALNKEKTKRQRDYFAADDRLGKVAYNRPVGQEDERDEIWGTGTENILSA